MTNIPDPVRGFLIDQVDRLDDLGYVNLGSPSSPFLALEIGRTESGDLEARVPPRLPSMPLQPAMKAKLADSGFRSEAPDSPGAPWIHAVASAEEAVDVIETTLDNVFDIKLGETVNIVHGSHRAEHEAEKKLDELRSRIEPVLTGMLGHPPERDSDGDYLYSLDSLDVIIAPRVVPAAVSLVRVIAITNFGVNVAPDLGLFLARLNFGLVFGRFALDAEHRSIWFDETLLGDETTDDELRFTINMVAETATEWAPRLQQMFGGITHEDMEETQLTATPKPGATAGYL